MKLKEYLEHNNIKGKAFAEFVGISATTLYAYMEGKKDMRLTIAYAIEKATFGKVTCQELAITVKNKFRKKD